MSDTPKNPSSLPFDPETDPGPKPGAYGVPEGASFDPETDPGPKTGAYGVPEDSSFDPETDQGTTKPGAYSVG